jgi:hypothetical protein
MSAGWRDRGQTSPTRQMPPFCDLLERIKMTSIGRILSPLLLVLVIAAIAVDLYISGGAGRPLFSLSGDVTKQTPPTGAPNAPAALPPTALRSGEFEGKITNFECGDNCYLTVVDTQGKEHTGLCLASLCNEWSALQAMPARYRGKLVRFVKGKGTQYDADGNAVSTTDAFSSILLVEQNK